MPSVNGMNSALGDARDNAFTEMTTLVAGLNKDTDPGQASAQLLQAQAVLGITDGVQNILAKGYNRWQQTGQ
jgi:hypothetical protein